MPNQQCPFDRVSHTEMGSLVFVTKMLHSKIIWNIFVSYPVPASQNRNQIKVDSMLHMGRVVNPVAFCVKWRPNYIVNYSMKVSSLFPGNSKTLKQLSMVSSVHYLEAICFVSTNYCITWNPNKMVYQMSNAPWVESVPNWNGNSSFVTNSVWHESKNVAE